MLGNRRRDRIGGLRLLLRSGGRTTKKRGEGEISRRRRRRIVLRGREVAGGQTKTERRRRAIRGGRRIRIEAKKADREKRKRRTNGDYRRRIGIGRRGAVVRREVEDRRERYLGRERRSLSTYVRVGYIRGSGYSTEAGRKYYRLGATASSRRVRGLVLVYGTRGIINREERHIRKVGRGSRVEEEVGRRLRVWVIRVKRGARPVHRWVADVYEGAPTMAGRYRRIVPKRSRRLALVKRAARLASEDLGRNRRLRTICGRGSVRIGGCGRLVQRRWKRYRAYSGIGNVGNIRRGGRRRTSAGFKARIRTLRVYIRIVRMIWGAMRRLGVEKRGHRANPGEDREYRERKYRTQIRGRRKENWWMGATRSRGRRSLRGRPPLIGFGAKRTVYKALVGKGMWEGDGRYRERAGRGLVLGRVGVFGYLRLVSRRMASIPELEDTTTEDRRTRKMQKEGSIRRGVGTRRRVRGWRNGEGRERIRDGRGR